MRILNLRRFILRKSQFETPSHFDTPLAKFMPYLDLKRLKTILVEVKKSIGTNVAFAVSKRHYGNFITALARLLQTVSN